MSSGSGSGGGSAAGSGSGGGGGAKVDPGQVGVLASLGQAASGGASALASFLGIDAANFTSNPSDKPQSGAGSGSGSGGGASS